MTILLKQRFMPLFLTQFFGAFNDNFFKNSLLIFIMFSLGANENINSALMMPLGAGLFILPFFILSATAGQIADKYEKSFLIKIIKFAEIMIMSLGAFSLYIENITLMFCALFAMGTQSTFFGPLKYSVLPEHLKEEKELISGNAWIEAGTFLSILLGTIFGGILIMVENGIAYVSIMLIIFSISGFISSLFIPKTNSSNIDLKVNYNFISETIKIVSEVKTNRTIFLSILGISWFWFVGATFLSQFPTFAKEVVGGDELMVTLFMTIFSIGIGFGSLVCNKLLKGKITAIYVPLSAIAMAIFSLDLYFASTYFSKNEEILLVTHFITTFEGIRIIFDLLLLSISGGVYIVPLYALLQEKSNPEYRARTIAANNVMNAFFMVASAVGIMGLLSFGFSIQGIFLVISILSVVVAFYICGLLPQYLFKTVAATMFKLLFKVEIEGKENFEKAGKGAVIVANHVSWLDGPLLVAFGPDDSLLPINTFVFKKWWGNLSKHFANMLPVDPTNPYATKKMIKEVEKGNKLVIFPEGRLTVTGSLMKIYDGPAMIADKAKVKIVPVKLEGVQFSKLSRLKGKLPLQWFPKIKIKVLEPVELKVPEDIRGRARRKLAGQELYDVMSNMMFATSKNLNTTLFNALLDAKEVYGNEHPVLEDPQIMSKPLSYKKVIMGSLALGEKISQTTEIKENVGFLLPNSAGAVITFFALQAYNRIPAMLNFSTGSKGLISACETACIKTVLTSKKFIEIAKLQDNINDMSKFVNIVYLEDIKESINLFDKLNVMIKSPRNLIKGKVDPESPAVVLFTSGSEGVPKGVVLSHKNILSNMAQIGSRISFNTTDIIFNSLPVFHSFGLTGGMLLPVLSGLKTFMYPSPLHYKIIPELIYDINATVVFGTDTFLANYAKKADPYDFYSVRYIVAGAEKVKDETRKIYMEKFMKGILEGYGATEASPVLAVNTPMHFKNGTVGRLLPGIEYKIESIPGVEEGGRLWVKGPNIMLGYYKNENPGILEPQNDNWYDTGDIVSVDIEGYVKILGRAKRFAKVAGEMISLTAVEDLIKKMWPDNNHAVVSIPDEKKGEQLVLFTDYQEANRKEVSAYMKETGNTDLMTPKNIRIIDKIPVLGTGKTDYVTLNNILKGEI